MKYKKNINAAKRKKESQAENTRHEFKLALL